MNQQDLLDLKEGFHQDISFEDYLWLPYPSASALKIGAEVSFMHMAETINGNLSSPDTKAKNFGRAVHTYIFERERFEEEYLIPDQCSATKKDGEQCKNEGTRIKDGEWVCGVHGRGLEEASNIISQTSAQHIAGIQEKLETSKIQALLKHGSPELTALAMIDEVMVKARFDWLVLGASIPTIVDLKKITAGRGGEEFLLKSIRDYGYDRQAALYTDVYKQVTSMQCRFLWLFVEDAPPYSIIPRYASNTMIQLGRIKYRHTLDEWLYCVNNDRFPGYGEDPEDLDPEAWETKRYAL